MDFAANLLQRMYVNIESYKKIEHIGSGSFGEVFLVENQITHKKYAAKIIYSANNGKPKDIQSEFFIYSKTKHPAIIQFHGLSMKDFDNKRNPTILLEYMPNGSISSKKTKLTKVQKYIILLGVAIGMKYLHDNMIVHRDLKSGNVLLDENYYPRICDFGLSTFSEYTLNDIKMDEFVGSPAYMAPEIFERNEYNFKIDVYSYSIFAYELITGKFPYKLKKYELKKKILEGLRPDLNIIQNKFIESFLAKCWSKNPAERPSFDEILTTIQKEEFKDYFDVDENEIKKYLCFIEKNLDKTDLFKTFNIQDAIYYGDRSLIKIYALSIFTGMGSEINQLEGLKYLKIAADMGDSDAMYFYGQWMGNGRIIKPNIEESIKYFKMAADHGNVNGMVNYARLLSKENSVHQNLNEAARYFKMASDYGDHEAMGDLGLIFKNGKGVPVDMNKAKYYLKLSADLGNSISMFNYANLLELDKNYVEAAKYYKMGIECGDTDAMAKYIGLRRFGIQIDQKDIIKYSKILAESGNQLGYFNYVKTLLENMDSLESMEEAGLYVMKGCNRGYILTNFFKMNAYKSIDFFKYFNIFTDVYIYDNIENLLFPIYLLSILANDGNINAQIVIGYLFYKGKYLNKNIDKAIYYYSLAANKNDHIALYNLGIIYSDKNYLKKDINKAINYFTLSSNQNNSSAQNNLGVIYSDEKYSNQDLNKAIHFYNLSAKQNNSMAQYNLGIIYSNEKYLKKRYEKSNLLS